MGRAGRGRSVSVEGGEVCEGVTVHRGMQTSIPSWVSYM